MSQRGVWGISILVFVSIFSALGSGRLNRSSGFGDLGDLVLLWVLVFLL